MNQLKTRLAVSEQEVRDKEQVLAKSSDLLGTEQESKVIKVYYRSVTDNKNGDKYDTVITLIFRTPKNNYFSPGRNSRVQKNNYHFNQVTVVEI